MKRDAAADEAIRAAMMLELGAARFDSLPMEDGEGGGRQSRAYPPHPPPLATEAPTRAARVNNRWTQAIERGEFNDDDAAMVAGMDRMEDGQLARVRRNADARNAVAQAAYVHVSQNWDENGLRRDLNGHVPPRSSFRGRGRGGAFRPGLSHAGDAPIDIMTALSRTGARPQPTKVPARTSHRAIPSRLAATPHHVAPRAAPARPAQVRQAWSQVAPAQNVQSQTQAQVSLVLPDGASVILQLPIMIESPALAKPGKQPGTVFLIKGIKVTDDTIIFHFAGGNVADVKHSVSELTSHMTADAQSGGLTLMFTLLEHMTLYYGVSFGRSASMNSFIEAIRGLRERQEQKAERTTAKPVVTVEGTVETPQSLAVEVQRPQMNRSNDAIETATAKTNEAFSEISQRTLVDVPPGQNALPVTPKAASSVSDEPDTIAVAKPQLSQPQPAQAHPNQPESTASSEIPTEEAPIPAAVLDDIVVWVMETAKNLREVDSKEINFDTIRALIRATSAAILTRRSPAFSQLSVQQRARFVVDHCCKPVERGFLALLAKDADFLNELKQAEEDDTAPDVSAVGSHPARNQGATSVRAQEAREHSSVRRTTYQIDELIYLRDRAVDPPHWLRDLGYLQDADRRNRLPNQRSHLMWDNPSRSVQPMTEYEAQQRQWVDTSHGMAGDADLSSDLEEGEIREYRQPRVDLALGQQNTSTTGPIPHRGSDGTHNPSRPAPVSAIATTCVQQRAPVDPQSDALASFLFGDNSGRATGQATSPGASRGLGMSRHNVDNLQIGAGQHMQELASLLADNEMDLAMAQTTEEFGRLRLNSN